MNVNVKQKIFFQNSKNHYEINEKAFLSVFWCGVILLKTFIERGILSLPYSASLSGWGFCLMSFILTLIFTIYSNFLIIDCKTFLCLHRNSQYHELSYYIFGYVGMIISLVTLIFDLLHYVTKFIEYPVMMINTILPIVPRYIWIIVEMLLIFLIALGKSKTLKITGYVSLVGVLCNFFIMVITIIGLFTTGKPSSTLHFIRVHNYPASLLYVGLIFCNGELIIPLHNHIRSPKLFKSLFLHIIIIVTGAVILFTFAGYLSYGRECLFYITDHFVGGYSVFSDIISYLYIPSNFCQALIFIFPLFTLGDKLCEKVFSSPRSFHFAFFRLIIIIISALPSFAFPSFLWTYWDYVGFFCVTIVAFVMPSLLHLRLKWKVASRLEKFVRIFMASLALFFIFFILLFQVFLLLGIYKLEE